MSPLFDKETRALPKGGNLNEVQALAEAILEAARVAGLGVTVSFDDGAAIRHIYVNDTAAEILGYTTEELLGSATAVTFAPEESERMQNLAARCRHGEVTPNLVETVVVRKDGERIPAEIAFSAVALAGEPAIVTFLRDIRERKVLQAQLVQSDRMATLGMLAAGVAHEINNPLAYATLNVETLVRQLQRFSPDELAASVGPAISAARDGLARVATIVRDLQSLSTPKSVERWPVDVKEVVESALNVTMHAIRGRARVVRDYREVTSIKTDPTRLGQILLNLVFNAAQSFDTADESKNIISLSIASPRPDAVVITVADNGRGIANEHLARIFEPFFTTKSKGIGLGLAICQTLANSLGGNLSVESEVGRGTKFALQLPAPGAHAESIQ
jgi:PAS domain S-box-containing protein